MNTVIGNKICLIIFTFFFSSIISISQPADILSNPILPKQFNDSLFVKYFYEKINLYLKSIKLQELQPAIILQKAAYDQATYMALTEQATLTQKKNKATTAQRLQYYGGSGIGEELIIKINTKEAGIYCSYKKLVDDILFKWRNGKENSSITNAIYVFMGIGAKLNSSGDKLFVSLILGNFASFNEGKKIISTLTTPITTRNAKLLPYNEKLCAPILKNNFYQNIANQIVIDNNSVSLTVNEVALVKKMFVSKTDGIVADIVSSEQYPCNSTNIYDNELFSKGLLLKPIYASQIQKTLTNNNNAAITLGTIPNEIKPSYQVNLLLLKENNVCAYITKTYNFKPALEMFHNVELLADTITIFSNKKFLPDTTIEVLNFKIPYEQGKADYKASDIEPFLTALDKPDFTIEELVIIGSSSIEGDEETNKYLQRKRAQSIMYAMNERQKKPINTTIVITNSWNDFKTAIANTPYDTLAKLSINDANTYITQNNLIQSLEPILKQFRYAHISMKVRYSNEVGKEQHYLIEKFNNAIKQNDRSLALAIQKYIFKKVVKGIYTADAVTMQQIPDSPEFAGLLMNKLWLELFISNDTFSSHYCQKIYALSQMASDNPYITFNRIYCEMLFNNYNYEKLQNEIEQLYKSTLTKETVDALNLFLQYNELQRNPNLTDEQQKKCIEKIKFTIDDFTDNTWQQALKLATMFIDFGDYDYAAKLLEPFIEHTDIPSDLLFTYISVCTYTPYRLYKNNFLAAVRNAEITEHTRLCHLFNSNLLPLSVYENPYLKKYICSVCK